MSRNKWKNIILCQETVSEIGSGKAQTLQCTLDNRAAKQAMPAVSKASRVFQWLNHKMYSLWYCWGPLWQNTRLISMNLGCKKKWLSACLQEMLNSSIRSCSIRVWPSVVDYDLGLTTLSQFIVLRLYRVQSEAWGSFRKNNRHVHWGHEAPSEPATYGNDRTED